MEPRFFISLGPYPNVGLGGGSILIVVLASIIWRRKKQKYTPTSFNSRDSSSNPSSRSELEVGGAYFGIPIFSYSELAKATNNFSHEKELGDGGFGTVYYAKLRDGREVAVKRLYEHNYRRVEQFMNEVEILTLNRIQKRAIEELVDPLLGYESDEEVKMMITSVAELAFLCLQQNKEMRPPMDVILEELKRIENGEWQLEDVKEERNNNDMPKNIHPPPSPPDCDNLALLKHIRVPSSPISVTAKWVSSNTTPNVSS
ncbi:hypothetical protein Patl1_15108 [Pistacia atlantica]|uniref:Uncharacterized protein n=1 Tax=Pistacia atlantica TaxID=434234 RepID=A0ACC1B5M1_9ROSI|nr:hypothetical protein Patl1_15108 [Pistacia atlantica]